MMKEIRSQNDDQDKQVEPEREDRVKNNYNSSDFNSNIDTRQSTVIRRSNTEISVGNTTISSTGSQQFTLYERLSQSLSNDQRVIKEISLGRRIAFYQIRGEIGTGNFSQVKLGIHILTKDKVAIKILDKTKLDQKTQRLLSREITSMERLHHPNIIRLYEVVETLSRLHIIMEFAGGGELFTKISNEGRLQEDNAKCVFAQLTAAVEHMHDNNIIHRDLKAENVFYASPRWIKVGDFGFSTISGTTDTLNTFCGSPPYAAPELFKDDNYCGVFVDIWAMGILLYFTVTGLMPFRAETVAKLKKCILDGIYTVPSYVSDSCAFLIRSILRQIPRDRLTIIEIKRTEWLTAQQFPGPFEPYNLNPTIASPMINAEENEVRAILSDLGIKDEHFNQANIRDSRNTITGIYRIVLHRIQKRRYGMLETMTDLEEKKELGSNPVRDKKHFRRITQRSYAKSVDRKPRSRTCSIL